jgi:hypothetical protein
MNSVGTSIAGMVHRIPADNDQMISLLDFSQRGKVFCPSSKIVEYLLTHGVHVSYTPVLGNLYANSEITMKPTGAQFTFGIFGEIRDESVISLIEKVLTKSKNFQGFNFKFVGGYKDVKMIEKLRSLQRKFPESIDLELCRSYKSGLGNGYRVIAVHEYSKALREVNAVLKLQISERYAASAVVQDAYSQGTPVIALENTESGVQITKTTPTLLLKELTSEELHRVKDEILKLKSIGEHVQQSWLNSKLELENLVSTF